MIVTVSIDKQFEQPYIIESLSVQPAPDTSTLCAQEQTRNSIQTPNVESSKSFLRIIEEGIHTIEYDALNYKLPVAPVSNLFLKRLAFANLVAKQSRLDMKRHVLSLFLFFLFPRCSHIFF